MKDNLKISESKIQEDLSKRSLIYSNSLINAFLIAFPITGIADFILLPELATLALGLRVVVAVLGYLLFRLMKSKNQNPNIAIAITYLLAHAVLGFEIFLATGEVEIFVYLQVVALILAFNAVVLWHARVAFLMYVLGFGLIAVFYSLELNPTFQGFMSTGASIMLMSVIIPLALPSARYSANRVNARKTLQLQNVLVELKSRNIELAKTKEELVRYEKEGLNRLRIGVHDVNNRVSSLDYLVELMGMKFKDNNELSVYLSKLKDVSTEIRVFTENVLSPPNTNQGEDGIRLEFTKTPVSPVLSKVLADLDKAANEKDIVVHQVLPKEETYILADQTYLTTAIRNLLRYAIRYSRSENQIVLGALVRNDKVLIEINDKTRGITQSALDLMFNKLPNPSQQKDTDTSETEGIGLSVAKYFIEKMGGRLEYETSIDKGLRFIIVFNKETTAENEEVNS